LLLLMLLCSARCHSSRSYGNRAGGGSDDGAGTGWGDEEQGDAAPAPAPAPRRKPKKPLVIESGSEGEDTGDSWGNF
jgi:hypothetical protein